MLIKQFQSYFCSCHVNMSFTIETEQNNKITFLDVNVIREEGKFATNVYKKLLLVVQHPFHFHFIFNLFNVDKLTYIFDSFLPDTYEFGKILTLLNRYFWICSNWSMLHPRLTLLKEIFQKNGYPENFIDRCFRLFLNRIHIIKEKIEKMLPYLETRKLQTAN